MTALARSIIALLARSSDRTTTLTHGQRRREQLLRDFLFAADGLQQWLPLKIVIQKAWIENRIVLLKDGSRINRTDEFSVSVRNNDRGSFQNVLHAFFSAGS